MLYNMTHMTACTDRVVYSFYAHPERPSSVVTPVPVVSKIRVGYVPISFMAESRCIVLYMYYDPPMLRRLFHHIWLDDHSRLVETRRDDGAFWREFQCSIDCVDWRPAHADLLSLRRAHDLQEALPASRPAARASARM